MIEQILLIVLSMLLTTFIFLFLIQKKKNIALVANTLKFLLEQEMQREESKTDKEQANEAFLKFISDSRDWAYTYIDEVQEGLNKFISDVEPEINYFKEYGDVGAMAPNYYSMKKIVESYEELKKLLPEDYDRIE